MSTAINRTYRNIFVAIFGLAVWATMTACIFEPNDSLTATNGLQLHIPPPSMSIDGGAGGSQQLRVWVLPEEEMEAAVEEAARGTVPVLTEDRYAALLSDRRASYAVADVSNGNAAIGVDVLPGRYHVQVELLVITEEEQSILLDATYLDWNDVEASLSGEYGSGIRVDMNRTTGVGFELQSADHVYPLLMTAGPARVSQHTTLPNPSTIFVEPLNDESNGLDVVAYPGGGVDGEAVPIVEDLDRKVAIYVTQTVTLEFVHTGTDESATVTYVVEPPAPQLGVDFLSANPGNEQLDVSAVVSLGAYQAPDDGSAVTYPEWWSVGDLATFMLEVRLHDSAEDWEAEINFSNVVIDEDGDFFEPYTLYGSEQSALSLEDELARDIRVRYSSPHFADASSLSEAVVAYPVGPIPATADFEFDLPTEGQFDTGDVLEVTTGEDLNVIVQFPETPAQTYIEPDDTIVLSVGGFADPVEEFVINAQQLADEGEMLLTLVPWADLEESITEGEEQPVIGVSADYRFLADPNGFAIWRQIELVELLD